MLLLVYSIIKKTGSLGQVRGIWLCRNESEKESRRQNTEYRIFTMMIL